MDWGAPWTFVLYRDRTLIGAASRLWNRERDGRGYDYFCRPEGGYVGGDYQAQFFVGEELIARATFVIRPEG